MWEAVTNMGMSVGVASVVLSGSLLLLVLTFVVLCFLSLRQDAGGRAHALALLGRLNELVAALRSGQAPSPPTAPAAGPETLAVEGEQPATAPES